MGSKEIKLTAGDSLGAFADAAVLIPLVAALSAGTDYSGSWLLLTAGLAYLAAGLIFRVPMAVQPLKAVAIAAIASGASQNEVRVAGAILGGVCLLLTLINVDRAAARVPRALIHGLQLALGIILLRQGCRAAALPLPGALALVVGALALVGMTAKTRIPWLGVLATAGLLWALQVKPGQSLMLYLPVASPPSPAVTGRHLVTAGAFRWEMVLMLALPQIALTLANSVVGTIDVAHRYFGDEAGRVTAHRLLCSIGIGNAISAAVGGLPFCHGSGGVTAHYRGGARHWTANLVIGLTLIALAGGGRAVLAYPPLLLGWLLAATGIFHWQLAAPSWRLPAERPRLVAMATVAAVTQNMLWVLAIGVLPDLWRLGARVRLA